jgi:hypothetical protein
LHEAEAFTSGIYLAKRGKKRARKKKKKKEVPSKRYFSSGE